MRRVGSTLKQIANMKRIFASTTAPSGSTKTTPAGNPFRSQDVIMHQDTPYTYLGVDPANGNALWAPPVECFPANNVEYPAYIENGVVMWKKRIVDNWGAYSNQKVIAISDTDIDVRGLSGRVYVNETVSLSLPAGFVNGNTIYTCRIVSKRNLATWVANDAGYFGKPFMLDVLFVKV